MNSQEAGRQRRRSETALQILTTRAETVALSLSVHQRVCDGLEESLGGLLERLVPTLASMQWSNRLFNPAGTGKQVVWVLIAPDFSGADKSVVSYRDLFFETAISYIDKARDSVICVGSSATDLAVAQGYDVLFTDSSDFTAQPSRPELAELLAQMLLDLAQQPAFGRATLLYLGPQQSVRHDLLPLRDYEGVRALVDTARLERTTIMPDVGAFLIDAAAVATGLAIGVAMSRAAIFAQTARYQGLQKTKKRVQADLQRLVRSISAIKSMVQQDEQTNVAAWFAKARES